MTDRHGQVGGSLMDGIEVAEAPARAAPRRDRGIRRIAMTVFAVALFSLAAALALRAGAGQDLAAATGKRTLIDSVTGEVFVDYRVPDGASLPLRNPKTGEESLYPAAGCYWTADGRAKWEPTYVYIPYDVDWVPCPDCGRPVVPHNPRPSNELMLEALERHKAGG